MKKANGKSAKFVFGSFVEDDQFNRASICLEQMRDLAELVMPEHFDKEWSGTQTALNLIEEKIKQVEEILTAGYDRYAPPRRVERPGS